MKRKLFSQVLSERPEGMGTSSRGWDDVVKKLKASGQEWALLTIRCAREATRDAVDLWAKVDRENAKK